MNGVIDEGLVENADRLEDGGKAFGCGVVTESIRTHCVWNFPRSAYRSLHLLRLFYNSCGRKVKDIALS